MYITDDMFHHRMVKHTNMKFGNKNSCSLKIQEHTFFLEPRTTFPLAEAPGGWSGMLCVQGNTKQFLKLHG